MIFYPFVNALIDSCLAQRNGFWRAKIVFVDDGVLICSDFIKIHVHQKLAFASIMNLHFIDVIHDEKVLRIFLIEVD